MAKEELIKEMAKEIYLKYMEKHLQHNFEPCFDPKKNHKDCLQRAFDFYNFVDDFLNSSL